MKRLRLGRLARRLLLAHVVVVLAGASAFVVAIGVLGPSLAGPGGSEADGAAVVAALATALGIGLGVALVAAVATSIALAVRIARPIEHLAATAGAIESGDAEARAALPGTNDELLDLALAFNAMASRLEATEMSRRRLLRDLTHELRTPVATIEGYLEGIRDGVVAADDDTFATMRAAAERLHRLVEDIGDVSRADEGVLELRPRTIDLGEVVASVGAQVQGSYGEADVSLVLPTSSASVKVEADPDRISQIVANLLDNARLHSPAGSAVTVTVDTDDGNAVVTVVDRGSGITATDLPHVFERFYRSASSRAIPGSGLGLTIARSLARAHGGDITAHSEGRGGGSTFVLVLPWTTRLVGVDTNDGT